jgi:hypothetical protein
MRPNGCDTFQTRRVIAAQLINKGEDDVRWMRASYQPDVSAGRRDAVDGHLAQAIGENRHEERSARHVNRTDLRAAKALVDDLR